MRAFYSPGRLPVWEKEKKAYYSFSLQLIQFLVETWAQWRMSSHPVSVTRDMRCEIFSQNVQIFLSRDGNLRKTSWNGATDRKSRAESTEVAARRRGGQQLLLPDLGHTLNTECYRLAINLIWLCQVAKRLRVFEYTTWFWFTLYWQSQRFNSRWAPKINERQYCIGVSCS